MLVFYGLSCSLSLLLLTFQKEFYLILLLVLLCEDLALFLKDLISCLFLYLM